MFLAKDEDFVESITFTRGELVYVLSAVDACETVLADRGKLSRYEDIENLFALRRVKLKILDYLEE